MDWFWTGKKPLSETVIAFFTDTFMCQSTWMCKPLQYPSHLTVSGSKQLLCFVIIMIFPLQITTNNLHKAAILY